MTHYDDEPTGLEWPPTPTEWRGNHESRLARIMNREEATETPDGRARGVDWSEA